DQCDDDKDGDGMPNGLDNCPLYANPSQEDRNDYDGDGTSDMYDICPKSNRYYITTFDPYYSVNLEFMEAQPLWDITDSGKEVQLSQPSSTSSPVMLIGRDTFGPVDFRCTTFVNGDEGGSYIGLVFGYQSNRKFYVAMWRHSNLNRDTYVAGIKGLQIKKVHSSTGPGSALANALWHSYTTDNEVELIWHDPLMQGWQHRTAYLWQLTFRPSIGLIRLVIQSKGRILTDTGDLFDSTFLGGHLGVFVYDQPNVIFSNMQCKCADR
ncbi:thrombospondin-2-like, partial [Diadema antillarum]|uniref:thrombospondin-2-like n=1 Tax=Diadema antillarum TaxID=105358 RepID=UPI003A869E5F